MADEGIEIRKEPERLRWALREHGELASILDYADDGSVVSMTRTFTNHPYRGRGFAGLLVDAAVADAAERGRLVRPMCWYVGEWFEQHPDRAALLA